MLGLIISIIIVGLIAGALARLIVPGRQAMSVPMTILLGIIGSFVGGLLGYLLFGKDLDEGAIQPSGIVGAIIGSVIALVVYNKATGRKGAGRRRIHA